MALQQGHTETVVRFAQAILDWDQKEETIAALLAANYRDGRSGLFMASKRGHTETVECFTKAIKGSNLRQETQDHLLSEKEEVDPAVVLFMNWQHPATI